MSHYVETATKGFTAGAAIAQHLRVKLTAGKLAVAGAIDYEIGTIVEAAFADLDQRAVRLVTAQGTVKMVASEAITAGAKVFAAASGKIASTGSVLIGYALETVTANNDVLEVLRSGALAGSQVVTPDDAEGLGNSILAGVTGVDVAAVTNNANDWIVLPALADVPVGHTITICCNAGGNFELRTPASSAEEINSENCDGTKEYLCTNTQVVKVIKISNTIGWMAHAFSALGTAVTAVVPD